MEKPDPDLDLLPIPKGESVPVLVPVPKGWMDAFDRIAESMKVDRPTFLLQLIARLAKSIATRFGGETAAPLSKEVTEGHYRTIAIAIPIDDLIPLEKGRGNSRHEPGGLDRRIHRDRDRGSPGFFARASRAG